MNELDDLKNSWQDYSDLHTQQNQLSPQEIERLLQERTSGTIGKLKRNMFIDMGIMFSSILGLIVLSFCISNERAILLLRLLAPFFIVVSAPFYFLGHAQLNKIIKAKNSLKENIQQLIKSYEWQQKLVLVLGTFSPAIGYLLGVFIVDDRDLFDPQQLPTHLGIMLLVTIAYIPMMRWYVKKMVGQHLAYLKKCLEEF